MLHHRRAITETRFITSIYRLLARNLIYERLSRKARRLRKTRVYGIYSSYRCLRETYTVKFIPMMQNNSIRHIYARRHLLFIYFSSTIAEGDWPNIIHNNKVPGWYNGPSWSRSILSLLFFDLSVSHFALTVFVNTLNYSTFHRQFWTDLNILILIEIFILNKRLEAYGIKLETQDNKVSEWYIKPELGKVL